MSSIWKSLSFRIWVFSVATGLSFAIPAIKFYTSMQNELILEHTKSEFEKRAEIASNVIETAIITENFTLLESLIQGIRKSSDFEFVAIVEGDSVFSCFPESNVADVFQQNDSLIYSTNKITSSLIKGNLVTAISKNSANAITENLGQPVFYLSLTATLFAFILFTLILVLFSIPIYRSIRVLGSLAAMNYDVEIKDGHDRSELGLLNKSLKSLRDNLSFLQTSNENMRENLQMRIDEATQDLNEKNRFSEILLSITEDFLLNKTNEDDEKFKSLRDALNYILSKVTICESIAVAINIHGETDKIILDAKEEDRGEFSTFESEVLELLSSMDTNVFKISEFPNSIENKLPKPIVDFFAINSNFDEDENYRFIFSINEKAKNDNIFFYLNLLASLIDSYLRDYVYRVNLTKLNRNLEEKVLEKTKLNLEISNALVSQEKLATIGEIAAGVAHDLNTPLGSIKAASQNFEHLFDRFISDLNDLGANDLIILADALQSKDEFNPMISASRANDNFEKLKKSFANESDNSENILRKLSKLDISASNSSLVMKILESENPDLITKKLSELLFLYFFNANILSAENQAEEVVKKLSRYIKADLNQERQKINLNKSIDVILPLFRHRIKDQSINLTIDIDEDAEILGIEIDLFQVWTNIIKNAIDALEKTEKSKILQIKSEIINGMVSLQISNNGPAIPEEIRSKIFQQFYTTKQNENGSGLGLSLVKRILAEHYGTVEVESNDDLTQFIIKLPIADSV